MRTRNSYSRILQAVANWGNKYEKPEIIRLLHCCVENDVTSYSLTDFEGRDFPCRRFGTALSESGLSRDKIQLIARIRDPGNIEGAVDALLLEAKTDYLDLVLFDVSFPAGKLIPEVELLMSRGKIVEIGSVNLKHPDKNLLQKETPLMANLFKWPGSFAGTEKDLNLDSLTSSDITSMAWLAWDEAYPEKLLQQDPEMEVALCKKYDLTPYQLLIAWLLNHPSHIHPVRPESDKSSIPDFSKAQKINFEKEDWLLLLNRIKSSYTHTNQSDLS